MGTTFKKIFRSIMDHPSLLFPTHSTLLLITGMFPVREWISDSENF